MDHFDAGWSEPHGHLLLEAGFFFDGLREGDGVLPEFLEEIPAAGEAAADHPRADIGGDH